MYKVETVIDCDNIRGLYDKDTEMAINSKNVKLINSHKEINGVCFNYALKDDEGYFRNCEESFEYLEDNYISVDIKDARSGDIISYHELDEANGRDFTYPNSINTFHFAIIKETKGTLESTIIKSKWGNS